MRNVGLTSSNKKFSIYKQKGARNEDRGKNQGAEAPMRTDAGRAGRPVRADERVYFAAGKRVDQPFHQHADGYSLRAGNLPPRIFPGRRSGGKGGLHAGRVHRKKERGLHAELAGPERAEKQHGTPAHPLKSRLSDGRGFPARGRGIRLSFGRGDRDRPREKAI
mgnify:CR=1 FL=1